MGLFDRVKEKASKSVSEQFENLKGRDIGGKKIGDIIKPFEDKANDFKDQREIDKTEPTITLKLIVGERLLADIPNTKIRRDKDGYYYFSNHFDVEAERYSLAAYDVRYPKYTTKTETKTTGSIKTNGRSGSALIGGFIAGPTGATVGAARGRKSTVDLTTKDVTKTKGPKFIKDPILTIKLISIDNKAEKTLHAITTIGKNLENANDFFRFKENKQSIEQTSIVQSTAEQLKELKELLDLEILTQEEFELKKKEILGL